MPGLAFGQIRHGGIRKVGDKTMMTIRGQTKLFTKRRKRLGRWRYFVTLLSALIVFCTVYALILPAITMERETVCGIAAHEHTEDCFDSGGELICTLPEHSHDTDCYAAAKPTEAEMTATEAETNVQPTVSTEEETVPEITVIPKKAFDIAATGSEITSDSIVYSKQIEKLGSDDDYTYRLHLTVDGTSLEGSTTQEEHVGGKTGIVLLVDVGEDFTATTPGEESKKEVVEQIVNSYLKKFKGTSNKLTVIAVKGAQSSDYDDANTTQELSDWDEFDEVRFDNYQTRFATNYKAGLLRARDYVNLASDNDLEKTAIVFITNGNPTWSVKDNGDTDNRAVSNKTEAKKDILSYLPKYLTEVCPNTDLHILDVEQASAVHDTPKAMGEYVESVERGSYSTASASQLIDAFDKIIQTIIPGDTTKNLVVSDTLSENVVFTDDAEATVTATLTQGNDTKDVDVTFDKTIGTVNYSHSEPIEGPFKLEIAFDIKIADGLYKPDEGYPDIGDAGTDYGSNTTSSGQPGFYSNSSGGYSCTVNSTELSGDFKHPVVQAPDKPQPKTQTVRITKHWADSLEPSQVQMQLYEQDGSTYQLIGTVILDSQQDATGSYSYTFSDGEVEKELYLVENDIGTLPLFSDHEVTINLGEGDIHAAKLILTPDGEPLEVIVTNWPKASMPATEGIGTYPLMIGGALLILIASAMMVFKKKQNSK